MLAPGGTIVEATSRQHRHRPRPRSGGSPGIRSSSCTAPTSPTRSARCSPRTARGSSRPTGRPRRATPPTRAPSPTASPPRRPGRWRSSQFANTANPDAHYQGTGPEIWRQTAGDRHPFRRVDRHRRNGQRHRPLPQGRERRRGAGRSAPTRPARPTAAAPAGQHPGRRCRLGLAARVLAGDLRPRPWSTRCARSTTARSTGPSAGSRPRRRCCSARRRAWPSP